MFFCIAGYRVIAHYRRCTALRRRGTQEIDTTQTIGRVYLKSSILRTDHGWASTVGGERSRATLPGPPRREACLPKRGVDQRRAATLIAETEKNPTGAALAVFDESPDKHSHRTGRSSTKTSLFRFTIQPAGGEDFRGQTGSIGGSRGCFGRHETAL